MDKKRKKIIDFEEYRNYFNDPKLWNKIKKVAKKAGIKVVYATLVLYYMSRDPSIPAKEKLKIYGALGYFILPTDFIPDALMGLGFTDDLAALIWALYTMSGHITPEIEHKAEQKLREWFGDYDQSEIAGLLPMSTETEEEKTSTD
ncbi:MAG: DUF1232 domain-containing protein [Muribaculaceae bacterium]|nr:DUF1232 domain-containing protein [Muribaculaceae bacterium]